MSSYHQPQAPVQDLSNHRIDPADGYMYTLDAFQAHYGERDGLARWQNAKQILDTQAANPPPSYYENPQTMSMSSRVQASLTPALAAASPTSVSAPSPLLLTNDQLASLRSQKDHAVATEDYREAHRLQEQIRSLESMGAPPVAQTPVGAQPMAHPTSYQSHPPASFGASAYGAPASAGALVPAAPTPVAYDYSNYPTSPNGGVLVRTGRTSPSYRQPSPPPPTFVNPGPFAPNGSWSM
eukprot:TRINITY_DN3820_c0_g1_i1.p2 TRINITY_DN3820_c0_g1~~TRINITY_DN3820_c0_g1_i1.p2  ORF type:complete len:259 (+),score=78.45 TRINITY_DN3820_c0_g1_i1:63-779(+)